MRKQRCGRRKFWQGVRKMIPEDYEGEHWVYEEEAGGEGGRKVI